MSWLDRYAVYARIRFEPSHDKRFLKGRRLYIFIKGNVFKVSHIILLTVNDVWLYNFRGFRKPNAKSRLEVWAVLRGILVPADSFAVLFDSFSCKEKRTYRREWVGDALNASHYVLGYTIDMKLSICTAVLEGVREYIVFLNGKMIEFL